MTLEGKNNNTVLSNIFKIILPVFWNKCKASSEVCAWAWGCSKVDMPWVRRQLLAPCLPLSWAHGTVTTLTRCKCSWLPWLGMPAYCIHTAGILVPLTLCLHTLLRVCTVITSWASPAAVRTHCWLQWCSLPLCLALGKSGGTWEAFERGSCSSSVSLVNSFSFTGPCQMPLRNCLDIFFSFFFFFFSLTTGRTG